MLISAILRELVAAGVTGDALVTAIERIEAASVPVRSAGAERQRRYRQRRAGGGDGGADGGADFGPEGAADDGADSVTRDVTSVTRDACETAPLSPLMVPPKNISNPPLNPPNPPERVGAKARSISVCGGFAEFWGIYPRRVAKAAAERAWPKACQRASPAQIIAAARCYAARPPDDPKFIPHPATWLNQARFEDETDDANAPRPPQPKPTQYRRNPAAELLRRTAADFDGDDGAPAGDCRAWAALPMPARH